MNIVEVLDELGIEHKSAGEAKDVRSGWVGIRCIWCGRGEFSLGVYPGVSCWRCGKHKLGDSLAEASGKPLAEVLRLLDGYRDDREPEPERRGKLVLPNGVGPMQRTHRRYLESRGFDPVKIEDVWQVQGIGIAERLSWRLWIPVRDRTGKLVSWTTRSLLDCKDRRYISAKPEEEVVSPKSVLYGEHLAGHTIIVVEGPTGAWRIGKGAVATLGASWTPAQANLVALHPRRVICFDRESAAQQRANELCHAVQSSPGQTLRWQLETGTDPGDADQSEIDQIRREFLR